MLPKNQRDGRKEKRGDKMEEAESQKQFTQSIKILNKAQDQAKAQNIHAQIFIEAMLEIAIYTIWLNIGKDGLEGKLKRCLNEIDGRIKDWEKASKNEG